MGRRGHPGGHAQPHDPFRPARQAQPLHPAAAGARCLPQDLRQAFRSLSKRFHPDTTTLPPAEAAAAFQRLQEAYAVLSDPQRRRAYDAQLRRAAAAVAATPPPVAPVRTVVRRPEPVRRPLSGGEWFALLLLACAWCSAWCWGSGWPGPGGSS